MEPPPVVPTVIIDLAEDVRFAHDIAAGGVFVPGCALPLDADCALVVRGPLEEIELRARVVLVDPAAGAGLELVGYSPALRAHLTQLFEGWCAALAATGDAPLDPGPTEAGRDAATGADAEADGAAGTRAPHVAVDAAASRADAGVEPDAGTDAATEALGSDGHGALGGDDTGAPGGDDTGARGGDDTGAPGGDDTRPPGGEDAGALDSDDTDAEPDPERRRLARNYYERLRGLSVAQQIKAAHSADPQERIILERLYNKTVWEPLLRNPRLTPPEVARIARMGTVPRILLEVIVGNGAWLQMPEVRRALLANPRLGTDQIVRVLRLLPKHELKLAAVQTAYPNAVRDAARRLLKG